MLGRETGPSQDEQRPPKDLPAGLEACPRCGEPVAEIIWGQTNCPRCGLHFECC